MFLATETHTIVATDGNILQVKLSEECTPDDKVDVVLVYFTVCQFFIMYGPDMYVDEELYVSNEKTLFSKRDGKIVLWREPSAYLSIKEYKDGWSITLHGNNPKIPLVLKDK